MDTDESRLLRSIVDRANARIIKGEARDDLDIFGIMDEALDDVGVIGTEQREALTGSIRRRVNARAAHEDSFRRRIKERWGNVLTAFDECIATAEEISANLVHNFTLGSSIERDNLEFRIRYYKGKQVLGGLMLKTLLLVALQARACAIAAEVGVLLEIRSAPSGRVAYTNPL